MPRSKDPLLRLLAKHHTLDEWERYTGPQGGEGWINTVTGEKVYQEEKPGSESSGGAESETYEKVRGIFEDAAYTSGGDVDMQPDALLDALQEADVQDTATALFDTVKAKSPLKADRGEQRVEWAMSDAGDIIYAAFDAVTENTTVDVELEDGTIATFSQDGSIRDPSKRRVGIEAVLEANGYSEKERKTFFEMLKSQNTGPQISGDRRMGVFNVVAVDNAGASGHSDDFAASAKKVEMLNAVREPMLKALRKMYGETITVYRGEESSDFYQTGDEYRHDGKRYNDYRMHRPAESFSLRPGIANRFGDTILKKEIPVEEVVLANIAGAGYGGEMEMLVAMDRVHSWEFGEDVYEYHPTRHSGDDKISPEEVIAAELRALKQQMNINQSGLELSNWQRYEGPQGGRGWINTETGEKVYQEEKPGSGDTSDAKSETYEAAKSIIEEGAEPGVPAPYLYLSPDALNEALQTTEPEDVADALLDVVETHYKKESPNSQDPRNAAIERVKEFVKINAQHAYSDSKVEVSLFDDKTATFKGDSGKAADYDSRAGVVVGMLKKLGFTSESASNYHRLIEKQNVGPAEGGSPKMESFNAVATEDIGASGHDNTYTPTEEEVALLRAVRGPMQLALRKMYGDTITLYRGETDFEAGGDYAESPEGKAYVNFDSHRPAESWSMRPLIAQNFGNFILKREVPIERVILANIVGAGYDKEAEMLIAMDKEQPWEHGESLFFHDDIEQDNEQLNDFDDNEVVTERELIAAELRAMKLQLSNNERGLELAEWVRYNGPRGGEGWQNTETGEVTYGEKPGDVDESQEQQTLPGAQIDTSKRYQTQDVWNDYDAISNIIYNVTDGELRGATLYDFYNWVEENGTEADIAEVHSKLATGPTPYDLTDNDVPDPAFNPNNYDEFDRLTVMLPGEMHGISAGDMYIAEDDNGDKLFITNLDDDVQATPSDAAKEAKNATVASKLLKVMNEDAPEHHLQEGKFLAVEEYDGYAVRDALNTRREREKAAPRYIAHLAANTLVGNHDPHDRNVFVGFSGFATIDLDIALLADNTEALCQQNGRQLRTYFEYTYGYETSEQEQQKIENGFETFANELEYKAGLLQGWLTEDESKAGISPDDLSDEHREMLEGHIRYIQSGKHREAVRELMR